MKKCGLLSTSAIGSAALFGATMMMASPAFAQDAAAAAAQDCTTAQQDAGTCLPAVTQDNAAPADEQTVTVTGTRIRSLNLNAPVPITSLTPSELPTQGQNNLGDALNNLPSLRSTFSQQNSGRFIGTAGQNFLDLRGLGTTRTLVLVNGRRHVTASVGDFLPDVNTIPQDLLERVDIVTGGESAVYGSDAIAGVVNFVLMRNFDGIRIRGQGGISTYGDRGDYFTSVTAGRNFADGRGNIAVAFEYAHANPLYVAERRHFAQTCGFVTTDPEAAAGAEDPTTNSNGIPDNSFLCNVRSPGITAGGAIGAFGDGSTLAFDTNGNLVRTHPESVNPDGSVISTDPLTGITVNERDQLAVGNDRWTANLLAHFDVSEAFRPFLEAKFVHQRVHQEGQATFFQGPLRNFFGPAVPNLRCSNPFLNAQALATLQSFGICTNVANGTFALNRFNVDWGGRAEINTRETYRFVAGVEGDFNDDWHYEVAVNYGHFKSDNSEHNNLYYTDVNGNPDGFALAVDAVRNAAGDIVCRVNQTTVTRPDCVPINLFGYGAASQAALDFVNTTSHIFSHASELDITAYVSGDLSQLFELPGGPVGFSIGAEYRRETAFTTADPLSQAGGTFFNIFPTFDPPAFEVKEIYGELSVPLLRDMPFAHELTISGAARYSDYNTAANHAFAWNANAIWAPVRDVRFRANYSRSVRVPTLNDLFAPASETFDFLDDPCDISNINTGNHAAQCAAFGIPTTTLPGSPCIGAINPVTGLPIQAGDPFLNCVTNGVGGSNIADTQAGNPNLREEVGRSITLGMVVRPRVIPGLSLSVDYFDIKVTNLIAVLGAQQILSQCFNATDINNQFCQLLGARDQFGLFPTSGAVNASGVNFAKQTSRGIDVDLSYTRAIGANTRVTFRGLATYTLERNNYTDPTDPSIVNRILSEIGDPVFSGSLSAEIEHGPFSFRWNTRYISHMLIFGYEQTHSENGNPPENPDVAAVFHYPAVWYHDLRFEARVADRYRFYVGVDNVFNRLPPFGLTGTGAGGAIYSDVGRTFYAGARVDF
jgi:outer membrane receptor protein involved in Fe transport